MVVKRNTSARIELRVCVQTHFCWWIIAELNAFLHVPNKLGRNIKNLSNYSRVCWREMEAKTLPEIVSLFPIHL